MGTPSNTVGDDRGQRTGRFLPGNKAGKGNPLGQQVQRLRVAHLSAVTPADLRAIIGRLVKSARGGDVGASKLVLGYALGPPIAGDILEKL